MQSLTEVRNQGGQVRFDEIAEVYINEILSKRNLPTRHNEDHRVAFWVEMFGSTPIDTIRAPDIICARNVLAARQNRKGRPYSPGTVNRYVTRLSHIFTVCVRQWEILQNNPCRYIGKLRENNTRIRFLSPEERATLLDACRNSRSRILYPAVVVALHTGIREGEQRALTLTDIHARERLITVRRSKNGRPRSIPLSREGYAALSDWIRISRPKPGEPLFRVKWRTAWLTALRESGLSDFRWHDLRHTFASNLAQAGVPTLTIAELLGHRTLETTRRYAHLSVDHLRQSVEKLPFV